MLSSALLALFFLLGWTCLVTALRRQPPGLPASWPPVSLERVRLNETAADGVWVEIAGRCKGIVAWLLAVKGDAGIVVTPTHVAVRTAGLGGVSQTLVPLANVSATLCRQSRNLGGLAAGIAAICAGSLLLADGAVDATLTGGLTGVGLLAVGAALLAFYHASKRITLAISYAGGSAGVSFKPGPVDGVKVDFARALQIVDALNRRLLRGQASEAAELVPELAQLLGGDADRPSCPSCRSVHEPGSRFCDGCGASLA
jgi:hypothetical protein